MIPKIIHYCWLSNDPYPESIKYCIESWKKHLPDYEIWLWNFDRFPKGKSKWVDEAFEAKKYAFAADFIRIYALYHHGGIYLDSDVEVVKPFDNLLQLPYFMGMEDSSLAIEASTLGFEKGNPLLGKLLERYDGRSFYKDDGSIDKETLPKIIHKAILDNFTYKPINNLQEFEYDSSVINVLPIDWFSPKSWDTKEICFTDNTYSIHHFEGSWLKEEEEKKSGKEAGNTPLVSVMIPVYNVEKYLDRCVDSVVKQTYKNIEIILIDDGSTDRSPEMCERWAKIDSRIKVIHQDNKGLLLARKSAALIANGSYCMFLDSDDWLERDTCEICVKTIKKENADIVCYGFIIETSKSKSTHKKDVYSSFFNRQVKKISSTKELLQAAYIDKIFPWNICGKIYRTKTVRKAYEWLPDMNCNYAEDLLTSFFVYSLSTSFLTITNKFYHYRVGVGMSTKKDVDISGYRTVLEAYDNFNIIKNVVIKKELQLQCPVNILEHIENLLHDATCSYLMSIYNKPEFKEWTNLWNDKIGINSIVSYFIGERVNKTVPQNTDSSSTEECQSSELAIARGKSRKHLKNFQKMIYVSLFLLLVIIALVIYILI